MRGPQLCAWLDCVLATGGGKSAPWRDLLAPWRDPPPTIPSRDALVQPADPARTARGHQAPCRKIPRRPGNPTSAEAGKQSAHRLSRGPPPLLKLQKGETSCRRFPLNACLPPLSLLALAPTRQAPQLSGSMRSKIHNCLLKLTDSSELNSSE